MKELISLFSIFGNHVITKYIYKYTHVCFYSLFYYPLPILRWSPYTPFYPSFFHAFYAIYIRYQCFHSVGLTLRTVTSIHSKQLKNKIKLETRKQDESCQKIQDSRERYMLMLLSMNDEVSWISSQIVEQIEVIPEVVLLKYLSWLTQWWAREKETKGNSFLESKGLHKIENGFTINNHPEISYQLMDRVIKYSIHQLHKKFFHISKCTASNAEKTLELR